LLHLKPIMPSLEAIRAAVTELPQGSPLVIAIAGGTTGIGSYLAKALATTFSSQGSKLRVYIVGRNAARAQTVISECEKISPGSDWRFIHATDLALISEVDKSSAEIIKQETEAPFHGELARLDLLYMTHAIPILGHKRSEYSDPKAASLAYLTNRGVSATEEGLDALESTIYYSRIRFILQLMPLLTASPRVAHVVSVYAGSMENGVKADEEPIGFVPANIYSFNVVRKYVNFMKTFVFEELANKYAGRLSLIHIYPGLVDGPGFAQMPGWFRVLFTLMKPLTFFVMTSSEDCGMVMAYLATSSFPAKQSVQDVTAPTDTPVPKSSLGVIGGGAYSLGQRADPQTPQIMFEKSRKPDTGKKAWDHTMKTLDDIAKKNEMIA
jgi:NAD(P)-dependent dehydrogenase (short-subunit alcohol dehydrogenase family)